MIFYVSVVSSGTPHMEPNSSFTAPFLLAVLHRALGRPGNSPKVVRPRSFAGKTCQECVQFYIYIYERYIYMKTYVRDLYTYMYIYMYIYICIRT